MTELKNITGLKKSTEAFNNKEDQVGEKKDQ